MRIAGLAGFMVVGTHNDTFETACNAIIGETFAIEDLLLDFVWARKGVRKSEQDSIIHTFRKIREIALECESQVDEDGLYKETSDYDVDKVLLETISIRQLAQKILDQYREPLGERLKELEDDKVSKVFGVIVDAAVEMVLLPGLSAPKMTLDDETASTASLPDTVRGPRFEVRDPRSETRGRRPEVRGPTLRCVARGAEVRDPMSETRGPRPEVRDPKSETRAPTPEVSTFDMRGPRSQVRGPRFLARDPRSEIRGPRPEVRDPRCETRSLRPEVRGSRSEVLGAGPEVRDPRSETRGPRPEVRDPRFEVRRLKRAARGSRSETCGSRLKTLDPRFGSPSSETQDPR
eukprot:s266_g46.t1